MKAGNRKLGHLAGIEKTTNKWTDTNSGTKDTTAQPFACNGNNNLDRDDICHCSPRRRQPPPTPAAAAPPPPPPALLPTVAHTLI